MLMKVWSVRVYFVHMVRLLLIRLLLLLAGNDIWHGRGMHISRTTCVSWYQKNIQLLSPYL